MRRKQAPQPQQPGVATEASALPLASKGKDRICMQFSQRNSKYLEYMRSRPCSFCLRRSGEPHHVFKKFHGISSGGLGKKGSDYLAIAICRKCHDKIHSGALRPDRNELLELLVIQLVCFIDHESRTAP